MRRRRQRTVGDAYTPSRRFRSASNEIDLLVGERRHETPVGLKVGSNLSLDSVTTLRTLVGRPETRVGSPVRIYGARSGAIWYLG